MTFDKEWEGVNKLVSLGRDMKNHLLYGGGYTICY